MEENDTIRTRYIAKKLISGNESVSSTFLGTEVLGYEMQPAGVVKATVDTTKGVVNFERYHLDWSGEVALNLETKDKEDSGTKYVNDYTVQFKKISDANMVSILSHINYQNETALPDVEVTSLTEEEEEMVAGGGLKSALESIYASNSNSKMAGYLESIVNNFGNTRKISKKLITTSDSISCTFRGSEVVNYSIAPTGIVRATVDTARGIINITKQNPSWSGEISLSLKTVDGDNSSKYYDNDYTVQFKGISFADTVE